MSSSLKWKPHKIQDSRSKINSIYVIFFYIQIKFNKKMSSSLNVIPVKIKNYKLINQLNSRVFFYIQKFKYRI